MKIVYQVLLLIAAVVITYFIYDSIQRPIEFEKAKKVRYTATVEKLKDIRKAQIAYKDVYGQFTGSWDTLINFVANDSVRNVRKIGELTDSMIEAGLSEKKAIKLGLLIRDTVRISVIEAIFGGVINPSDLKMIPVPGAPSEFPLASTIIITGSGISVPVFEAKAHNNIILNGLNPQLIIRVERNARSITLNSNRRILERPD